MAVFLHSDWENCSVVKADKKGTIHSPQPLDQFVALGFFASGRTPVMVRVHFQDPSMTPTGTVELAKFSRIRVQVLNRSFSPESGIPVRFSTGSAASLKSDLPPDLPNLEFINALSIAAAGDFSFKYFRLPVLAQGRVFSDPSGWSEWDTVPANKSVFVQSPRDALVRELEYQGDPSSESSFSGTSKVSKSFGPGRMRMSLNLRPGETRVIYIQMIEETSICGFLPPKSSSTRMDFVTIHDFHVEMSEEKPVFREYIGEKKLEVDQDRDFCFAPILPGRKLVQGIWWHNQREASVFYEMIDVKEGQSLDLGELRASGDGTLLLSARLIDSKNGQLVELSEEGIPPFRSGSSISLARHQVQLFQAKLWLQIDHDIPLGEEWAIHGIHPGVWSTSYSLGPLPTSIRDEKILLSEAFYRREIRFPGTPRLETDLKVHLVQRPLDLVFHRTPEFPEIGRLSFWFTDRYTGKYKSPSGVKISEDAHSQTWRFYLPDGDYALFAKGLENGPETTRGFWSYGFVQSPALEPISLALQSGETRVFQIVNTYGAPVSDVSVQMTPDGFVFPSERSGSLPFHKSTDDFGMVRFHAFPPQTGWGFWSQSKGIHVMEVPAATQHHK
ncbi:MAG: hypothetical protein DWQ01_12125 [Planctomycetota bacterium]|nr:MAG: hypothetical protein DWQ01_12125 [Planctomycetota bacterium]